MGQPASKTAQRAAYTLAALEWAGLVPGTEEATVYLARHGFEEADYWSAAAATAARESRPQGALDSMKLERIAVARRTLHEAGVQPGTPDAAEYLDRSGCWENPGWWSCKAAELNADGPELGA